VQKGGGGEGLLGGLFGGAGKKAKKDDVEDAIEGVALPPNHPHTHLFLLRSSTFVLVKQVLVY
jgi:hypothetical protein